MTTAVSQNVASLASMHAKAQTSGFWGERWTDFAVWIAVSKAAERRGHADKIVIGLEWYRPESFGDDDASTGGWLLKLRSGQTRTGKQIVCDRIDAAILSQLHEVCRRYAARITL